MGLGLIDDTRGYLDSLEPRRLAELLIGGMSTRDLPAEIKSGYRALAREDTGVTEYLMPPLPNTLYTRDTTCWIYGGSDAQSAVLAGPPRRDPVDEGDLRVPSRLSSGSTVWWGDPEKSWGLATIEGGDVLVPGNGVVLIGMSERTSRQAITQVAAELFAQGAAEKVIVAGMPKLRAAMHLDTVFTFADRDVVTIYPEIVDDIAPFTLRAERQASPASRSSRRPNRSSRWSPRHWVCRSCGSSKPVAPNTTRNASSGTAATTWSPSNRVWCSPTTATPTPTRCCARPASRSSPSSAPNWAAAAAAATA